MKFNYIKLISACWVLAGFITLPSQVMGQGAGSVRFDASIYSVVEAEGSVNVTVNRERGNKGAVSVEYVITDGTATSAVDYEGSSGILTWADGEQGGKSITISILNDALLEEQETVLISLANPQGGLAIGQLSQTTIIIDGAESGSLGFARDSFITSEGDRYVEIMVTRGLGATGAILVDYEVLGGNNLTEEQIGGVWHSRRLPDGEDYPDIIQNKFVPGKKASPNDDFVPTEGTLFFRDNEMSKLFRIELVPNLDGRAYPFTMAEMVLSNVRAAEGEPDYIQPVLNPEASRATLRINDVFGGPETDLIWEQEVWPDSTEPDHQRVGFRFGRARYRVSEGDDPFKNGKIENQADKDAGRGEIEIPVYRSYPLDESVEVSYMVGPNRGFLVDDARENWVNEVAKPTPWTGDPTATGDDLNTGTKYLELPGDEPRISPNALTTNFLRFGDPAQGMHSRLSLPQLLLSPGSDLPTPSGDRVFTPSFYNSFSNGPVMRDFHVVTGTLNWEAEDLEPKVITIQIVDDTQTEFSEDMIVVLYIKDYEMEGAARDEEVDLSAGDGGGDGDGDGDGDGEDEPDEERWFKPGVALGVQYWTVVTILDDDPPAGSVETAFAPQVNNDVYDIVSVPASADPAENLKEEKIYLVGDFTAIGGTQRNRIVRLNQSGLLDSGFDPGMGANAYVNSISLSYHNIETGSGQLQLDARPVIGGGFTAFNGFSRRGVARLNSDGSVDETFDPGLGIDGEVYDLLVQPDKKVLVVGDFVSVNGQNRRSVARLNEDGSLDEIFNPEGVTDGVVNTVTMMPNSQILIAGDFIMVGDHYSPSIAMLDAATGTIDPAFVPGDGVDGEVFDVDVYPDGKILMGGNFSSVNGTPRNNIAQLYQNGSVDFTFNPGDGLDGPVHSVVVDDSVNVVGSPTFSLDDQEDLFQDLLEESLDEDNPDEDDPVLSSIAGSGGIIPPSYRDEIRAALPPMYRVLIGGTFTQYNGTRRVGLARLNPDGTVDTSFMDTAYNQFAGLAKVHSFDVQGIVNVIEINETDGGILLGGVFDEVGGGSGGALAGGLLGGQSSRATTVDVSNIAKLSGGETWGPGAIEFVEDTYTAAESGGSASVSMRRKNGSLGTAGVRFKTHSIIGNAGVAEPGTEEDLEEPDDSKPVDFISKQAFVSWSSSDGFVMDASYYDPDRSEYYLRQLNGEIFNYLSPALGWDKNGWMLSDGSYYGDSATVQLVPDDLVEGNEVLKLELGFPFGFIDLAGEPIPLGVVYDKKDARLTILDDDFDPGRLQLTEAQFFVEEGSRRAAITVERTAGLNGLVSVDYETSDGTAVAGLDYSAKSGTLTFASGQNTKTFYIRINEDEFQEGDEFINIVLSRPRGGAVIPQENEAGFSTRLVIIDNDLKSGRLELDQLAHEPKEDQGVEVLHVRRSGGSQGRVSVDYEVTSEGIEAGAVPGEDYVVQSGTLIWNDGDITQKQIEITILDDDVVEEDEQLMVRLSNSSGAILTGSIEALVTIKDDDSYGIIELGRTEYYFNENGREARIFVVRKGGFVETQEFTYATLDLTAKSGGEMPDYTGVSGTLSLEPGQSGASFVVNLIDDESLENTEQFGIELSNINGGAEFGDKTKAVVNIIDNEALNVPSGDLDVTFRLGTGADGIINTLEILPDGRVLIGGGFTVFNGIPVPNLTRLLPDGNVDMSFVPGQGPNGHIQDIVELSSGFLLAVGDFTTYNGNNLKHIVRLNVDGALDSTFDAGAGTDGSIQVAIEDSEGRILLGGNFTSYNGFPSSGLVRINGNGSIDQSFDVGSGVNGTVESIVLDWEDGIILSGSFDSYNGIQVPGIVRLDETGSVDLGFLEALPKIEGKVSSSLIQEDGRILVGGDMLITVQSDEGDREYINIIRLNRDGSVDLTFQPISSIAGSGNKIDGIVRTIVVQPDGRIILGGDFREFGGLVRSGLLRLDHNGELDNSINFGLGANGSVRSIAVQNDFRIVIVGDFTSFNGVDARGIARIYGGLDYNPGEIRFEKPSYIVNENGVSDAIYIIREGGVSSQGSFKIKTSSITAVDGQDYLGLKDISVVFEAGVVFKELLLAYIPSDIDFESVKNQSESGLPILNIVNDQKAEDPVLINLELIDFDGAKAGDQTISQVSLISDDSVVQIVPGDLVFAESLSEGAIGLEIRREGGVENAISVDFNTFDGTAVSSGLNPDYVESYGTIHFEAGESSRLIRIPVIDDTHQEGVETLYLRMSNAKPSSSAHLGGDSVVQLQIQDGDRDSLRSTISLKASEFRAYESSGEVEIRVVREGDLSREAIASFSTTDQTAIEGADYDGSMGHVFFKQGSSEEVIRLAINDDVHAEGDESFEINLLNSQGASIGELETASVVIVDAEAGTLIFSAWNDETDWINDSGENKLAWDGVQITDEDNELDIDWNLRDYQYFVSEKESMVPYDSAKENSLSQMTTAPWYWGSDTKISADLFQKVKDQTHRIGGSHLGAPITITRVRGSTGRLAVDYSTSDGSAKVGEHYSHVDGVIYFDDHEMSKTIIVPIIAGGEFVDKVIDQATGKVVNVTVPSVDFKLRLFNARVAEGEPEHLKPYLADQAGNLQDDITATININRQWLSELRPRTPDQETDDVGFQFHRAKFRVKESQGSVRIWINRGSISEPQNGVEALGSYAGTATVSYAVGPNFVRASGDSPRPIKNWPEDGLIPYNFYGTRRFVNAQGDTDPPFEDELFPNFNQPWESPVPKLDLEPGSDYASPGLDFQPITGQLSFGPGVTGLAIDIPILNDDIVEFNEDFFVFLYNPTPDVRPAGSGDTGEGGGWAYVGNDRMAWLNGGTAAGQYYCKVTILSDDDFGAEQPAGAVNRNFNPDYQSFTQPPLNSAPGANDDVHAVAIQPVVNWQDEVEQKIIIGGDFNAYNTVPRGKIARLNPDGSLDRWFNIGSGADDFINTVLVRSDSKILIGGGFTSYNGTVRYSLAQLENNGALDTTFDVGSGADGAVRAMAFVGPAQSLGVTDKRAVIIAGDFTTFNGVKSTRVARVLSTGELDESLFMREGPNGPVYSVAVQEDGKIIIGGDFTMYDEYRRGNVTRINVDGTLDEKFEAIIGADDTVHSVFLQPDGKILLGGSFKAINAVPRNGIARLNADGSVDESFDPGSGFDAPVLDVSATGTLFEWPVGDDGDTVTLFRNVRVYAGGLFTHFSGTRRMGVARLYGNGTLDTTFMDTAYNQFAGLHKEGVSSPANHVGSLVVDENGDVIIGGSFDSVGGGFTRDDVRNQLNVAKLVGGGTPGPGNIELANDDYAVDENTGELFVLLNRRNGSLGAALANVGLPLSRIGSGIATAADDYEKTLTTVVWPSLYRKDTDSALNGGGWMRSDAHFGFNNEPTITSTGNEWPTVENNLTLKIHEDRIVEGNEKLIVKLSYPRSSLYLGGEKIAIGTALGRNHATISIIDNDFSYGVIKFSQQQLFIDENQAKAVVLVERIKGSVGEVSVDYDVRQINHDELMANDLSDDAVAVATGVLADFIPAKNTLTFGPGETVKQIEINIINDIRSEIDEALALTLFNPKGGAVIDGPFGVGSSIITIIDDDYSSGKIEFVSGDNHFMENEGKAVLSVRRIGGSVGAVSVEFMVQEATAREGEDYMYESQLLEWADGDTANKHIQIELLDDKFVDQDRHFSIVITSAVASQNRDVVIGRNKTDVTIREDDSLGSISFAKSNHSVNENSGQFIVNVIRSAGYNESVSIDYEVASGSALEALDFVEQKGTLNFHEGQKSAFFSVAVMDDKLLEGHETIGLILSNPKPLREGQSLLPILGTPNMATLTIVDDEASNEPAGLIDSSFVTVGGSDDSVQVLEMQGDSKILIGGGFNFVNGLVRNGLARLNSDGNIDTTFQIGSGFDGVVRSLAIQPDQRIIAVGYFTQFDGVNRNGIVRLNQDGGIDETFNPGGGADNPIQDVLIQDDGRIIIVGDFTSFNGVALNRIARLHNDGRVDETFNVGSGANFSIHDVSQTVDGGIVLVGDFNNFNGYQSMGIVVLHQNGEIDESFDSGIGFDASARSIVVQDDGKILVGGFFSNYNGDDITRLVRLNPDGSRDPDFDCGSGADGSIYTLALQSDGKIFVGGSFGEFNGLKRNAICRLNPDGSVDPTINFGTGPNGSVLAIYPKADSKILIGGGFTKYNDIDREHFVQIHGGILDGSGTMQFVSPTFMVGESGTNAVVRVIRNGGLRGEIKAKFNTLLSVSSHPAVPGLDFEMVDSEVSFRQGEIFHSIEIPIINDDEVEVEEDVDLRLSEFSGDSEGLQSNARLLIASDDSFISFVADQYSVAENSQFGYANILIERIGDVSKMAEVTFMTKTNGTALATLDFQMISNAVTFLEGDASRSVEVPIVDDSVVEGYESVTLLLTNAVGNATLDRRVSNLNIVDDDFAPGQFYLENAISRVHENAGFATLTVMRTNGYTGIVEIEYAVSDLTAINGEDYVAINGKLVFSDAEDKKTFDIPIIDDKEEEGAEAFRVRLFNVTGNGSLRQPSYGTIVIIDDELQALPGPKGIGADGPVYSVTITDQDFVYLGGEFQAYNGAPAPRLLRLLPDGSRDAQFIVKEEINNTVFDLEVTDDGKVWIGGLFGEFGDSGHSYLAALNEDGSIDSSFDSSGQIKGPVFEIVESKEKFLVGGEFGIKRFSRQGVGDDDFHSPKFDGSVYAIDVQADGKILVGGTFSTVDGHPFSRITRLKSSGVIDETFNVGTGANGNINTVMALADGGIVLGGSFISIDGYSARRFAKLLPDGSLNREFTIGDGFNGTVNDIFLRADGRFLIGGSFTRYDDSKQDYVVLLENDGTPTRDNFDKLNLNNTVYSLSEKAGGLMVLGGSFTQVKDLGYNYLALAEGISAMTPASLTIQQSVDGISLNIVGEIGEIYVLEISDDLVTWLKLSDAIIPESGSQKIDLGPSSSNRYFRAVYRE